MRVFFYGLFMDEELLAGKGITPSLVGIGYVDGFALSIGDRATLVPHEGARAYGIVAAIGSHDAAALYSEQSVADYVPEPVLVALSDGGEAEATCYNLSADKVAGTNPDYAKELLDLAERIGFPDEYVDEIRRFCE